MSKRSPSRYDVHDTFWKEVTTSRRGLDGMRSGYVTAVTEFPSGITVSSFVSLRGERQLSRGFGDRKATTCELTSKPITSLNTFHNGWLSHPDGLEQKEQLKKEIVERRRRLSELEAEYNFELDRDELGDIGQKAFYPETPSLVEWASVLDNPDRSLGT